MKTNKILVIVILVILVLPLIGYGFWQIKKGKALEIFVVNKSMIDYRSSENKAFSYLLNTKKIVAVGNRPYNLKVDHFGLIWNNGDYQIKYPRLKDIDRTAEKYDMVYYADAAGIKTSSGKELKADEVDKVLYGGVNVADYNLLKHLLTLQKPLVIESNYFGPPTDPLVRYNIENLIDIYYVGWIGKYVKDLSGAADLMPGFDWKERYKEYTGFTWEASGPGIVMINQEAKRVFILEEGKHINTSNGFIQSSAEAQDIYDVPANVNYNGWFTVIHPGRNIVLSEFELNPTEEGLAKLNEFGVPDIFPALIHADENFYFLAGDFGKCKSNDFFAKVAILGPIYNGIKKNSIKSSNFFYSFYQPFMTTIIDQSLELKKNTANE